MQAERRRSNYLFAFNTDLTIDLSGLNHVPLIGQALPAGQNLDLAFEVVAHSDGFDAHGAFRNLLPKGSPTIPEQLAGTFQILTTVHFGDFTKQIDLNIGATDLSPTVRHRNRKHWPPLRRPPKRTPITCGRPTYRSILGR